MEKFKHWLKFRPWQRHGLVLMVGGLVYILVGAAFITIGELSERRSSTLAMALNIMDLEYWAYLFIAAGLLACLSSRWPSFADSWGYMVLTGLSAGWSGMYFLGVLFGLSPLLTLTYGLVWGLMAFMWWAISGLVNPEKVVMAVQNGSD